VPDEEKKMVRELMIHEDALAAEAGNRLRLSVELGLEAGIRQGTGPRPSGTKVLAARVLLLQLWP